MGTTVTTNLGLIKPDVAEKIKEELPTYAGWAAQNAINMDKIDALFRGNTATYTLNWTAGTTNPTLGAGGFTEGKYVRLLPRLVLGFFRIYTGGAGFATGSTNYSINLPVPIDPIFNTFDDSVPIGKAIFRDDSAIATSSTFTIIYSSVQGGVFARPAAGGTWTNANPVVPAQQDRISGYVLYPTVTP